MLFSTSIAYLSARALQGAKGTLRKKAILIVSLSVDLGILFLFKYFNFFRESFSEVVGALGINPSWPSLNIVLPVGISFYTFQSVGYVVDVYRGEVKAQRNFLTYLLFILFFPQLVAGPIEKASRLFKQIEGKRSFDWRNVDANIVLVFLGSISKSSRGR